MHKKSYFLQFSLLEGAILGGDKEQQRASLEEYIYLVGLIFQIRDNILDREGKDGRVEGNRQKRCNQQKNIYPVLLTM